MHWFYLILPALFAGSLWLTGRLRRYALSSQLLDIPNGRSSHTVPTPRGGGLAFVMCFLVALLLAASVDVVTWEQALALGGAGAGVGGLGWLDDRSHIAARWRLAGHFASAVWLLAWLGGLPYSLINALPIWSVLMATGAVIVCLVWLLNLYNFMDGIDGLASVQALVACLGMSAIYWYTGAADLVLLPLLLAAAVAGFLVWNFPPARIFMGDAGSGFLGITLGGLIVVSAPQPTYIWCWLILLGVFVVDASWTLAQRFLLGHKVYEAHRSHAYQILSRRWGAHRPVTLGLLGIGAVWLFPIALGVGHGTINGAVGLAIAYLPLLTGAALIGAGKGCPNGH